MSLRIAQRYAAQQARLPVPIVPQSASFSCGSACLLAVLLYWKGESLPVHHEMNLWHPLHLDTDVGVDPEQLATLAEKFGLEASCNTDLTLASLQEHLRRGNTVILCLQAWKEAPVRWRRDWKDGHYVVLIGSDDTNVYFMDPSLRTSYGWMSLQELKARWHNPGERGEHQFNLGVVIRGTDEPLGEFPSEPQQIE